MSKPYIWLFSFLFLFAVNGLSQENTRDTVGGFHIDDSAFFSSRLLEDEISKYIRSLDIGNNSGIVGGYIESIFHESIDSAQVIIKIEGKPVAEFYTRKGLYYFVHNHSGKLVDISILHPDFHVFDTAFIIPDRNYSVTFFQLIPKHKILLRGRVFAGRMPLAGVNVNVLFEDKEYNLLTKGCYYDDEDYWNCLFDGMFKQNLTAENTNDSIYISITRDGMKPLSYGMTFNEYTGEIIQFKMNYSSSLPNVPLNSLNLRLGFPFLSADRDWFVSLSYYRLLNNTNLRRIGIGLEGDMFLSTITVSHPTLPGRDIASYDSSYVFSFAGPSAMFWILEPERRFFGTYAGCTFSFKLDNGNFIPQPFIGTRFFLDINKAVSFEFRYAEFSSEISHYTFNLYGNASKEILREKFRKINVNLGIQIVF